MGAHRACRLNIRLTEAEFNALHEHAKSAGITASDYVRKRVFRDENRPIIRTDAETLIKLYGVLRKQGGLLNQCARELNTRHKPNEIEQELDRAFKAVAQASEDVSAFIADARNSI